MVLDCRNALLGGGGREVLRCPSADGSPAAGRTTTDRMEAIEWAKLHSLPPLWLALRDAKAQNEPSLLTVAAASERYIESLKEAGPNGTRVIPRALQSRVSNVRLHVKGLWGPMLLAGVQKSHIKKELDALTTGKVRQGAASSKKPASAGLKKRVLEAFRAVWNHSIVDRSHPTKGILFAPEKSQQFKGAIHVNNLTELKRNLQKQSGKGAMTHEQVRTALVGAMHRDGKLCAQRKYVNRYRPWTAHLLAVLVSLGVRISEARKMRWCEINFDVGFVLIHQAKAKVYSSGKQKHEVRIVPLQHALVPWLLDLARFRGIVDTTTCEELLFATSDTDLDAERTEGLSQRAVVALRHAGVKPPKKRTHWGRSTWISWATMNHQITAEEVQHFVGHQVYEGTTDEYVEFLLEMLKPEHRDLFSLPTPEEVKELTESFVPVQRDWREDRAYAREGLSHRHRKGGKGTSA